MAYAMSGKEIEKMKNDTNLEEAGESKAFEKTEQKDPGIKGKTKVKAKAKNIKKIKRNKAKNPVLNQELTS